MNQFRERMRCLGAGISLFSSIYTAFDRTSTGYNPRFSSKQFDRKYFDYRITYSMFSKTFRKIITW